MIRYADLTGKVALITGSTSGIGLATAKELARVGANICLNGFGCEKQIESIRADMEKEFGVKVRYVNANLETSTGVFSLIDQCKESLGEVDVLVNNVGRQHVAAIEDFPDELYHSIIELNLNSYFYTIKKCLPHMKRENWGRIINIASVHGLVGSVQKTPYVAAKHGVVGMTKVVALEVANTDICVNTVCPGFVYTDLITDQISKLATEMNISYEEAKKQLIKEKQPSEQAAHPEHIGQTIAFLCSEAASSIKGTSITIDGAWTAQ